ncbi:MAG: metalloregulator ArsR/SmtB family transcription factor [Candidatus Aminicenantes bacterium]|nr:metalloregulator ArsR/SmtB family transcription factor [Candidatus Aminicenantes bacterium]
MTKPNRCRKDISTDGEAGAAQARMFRALAHPARIRLIRRLMEGDCCVSEAEACLKISQPNVSQHLKILKTAGLIVGERRGAKICYRLIDARVERVLRALSLKENLDEEHHRNE